ncbi:MAG: hypothetical protein HY674_03595 [Chloroflexi bacterium]|nr:hypothetical protein [Chloroflexota bacterium]
MNDRFLNKIGLLLFCLLYLAAGCGQNKAPEPLALDQIPAAVEKAFSKAKPEIKNLAKQAVTTIQSKDYTAALLQLQNLSAVPQLTAEQLSVATRSMLTVNAQMQAAASQGDAQAAEVLKMRTMSK